MRSEHLDRTIRGFEDKAIIDPLQLSDFPGRLRRNLEKVFKHLSTDDEKTYIRSLLDPFHPMSHGGRVPSILPRETATFNLFQDLDLPESAVGSQLLVIVNYELQTPHQIITLDLPNAFYSSAPVQADVGLFSSTSDFTIQYIPTGLSATNFLPRVTATQDLQAKELFVKQRTVSAAVRFIKTSTSDNESGQIDMHYSRDGAAVDETTPLNTLFSRPSDSSKRVYLAGTSGMLRSAAGFVV